MSPARIAVVIPTLDTPGPLARVLAELADWERRSGRELLPYVVDDGSARPLALSQPRPAETRLLRHAQNRGYGGAQKTGFAAALARGCGAVVLLHGDGQYATAATVNLALQLEDSGADAMLGSRFLPGPATPIPGWRRLGNRGLTRLANLRFGAQLSELHTGARAYAAARLNALPFDQYSDNYVFDHEVLAALLHSGAHIGEAPVAARYDETVRSIPPLRAVRYGLGCLRTLLFPPKAAAPTASPRRSAQPTRPPAGPREG
ncbi:MAG: glycosyltransferase family 2 protein [Deltaproteobacteria bacterium]|nr:glycosyltransferase family 2 protein [Deltaproteobacteria bacterium]